MHTRTHSFIQQMKNRSKHTKHPITAILLHSLPLICVILVLFLVYISDVFVVDNNSQNNAMSKHLLLSSFKLNNARDIEAETKAITKDSASLHLTLSKSKYSPEESHKPKRKRYAFAITITKDGFFEDGAAVLSYSIMKHHQNRNYDISFVAFVHPNVTKARRGLTNLGFHVIEVPIPINRTAIRFEFLREKIDKNGCCGSSELIKLTSYR